MHLATTRPRWQPLEDTRTFSNPLEPTRWSWKQPWPVCLFTRKLHYTSQRKTRGRSLQFPAPFCFCNSGDQFYKRSSSDGIQGEEEIIRSSDRRLRTEPFFLCTFPLNQSPSPFPTPSIVLPRSFLTSVHLISIPSLGLANRSTICFHLIYLHSIFHLPARTPF